MMPGLVLHCRVIPRTSSFGLLMSLKRHQPLLWQHAEPLRVRGSCVRLLLVTRAYSHWRLRSSRRDLKCVPRCGANAAPCCPLLFPGPPRELFGARLPSSAARGFSREHLGQRARMFFSLDVSLFRLPCRRGRLSPRGNSRPHSSRVCGGLRQDVPRSSGTLDAHPDQNHPAGAVLGSG